MSNEEGKFMRMQKKQFRIGELAKKLKLERFVIRFWEKEFDLKTTRSNGGQRFYDEKSAERFKLIKTLLYEKQFTIKGARNYIKDRYLEKKNIIGSHTAPYPLTAELTKQLALLQQRLIKLQELL